MSTTHAIIIYTCIGIYRYVCMYCMYAYKYICMYVQYVSTVCTVCKEFTCNCLSLWSVDSVRPGTASVCLNFVTVLKVALSYTLTCDSI